MSIIYLLLSAATYIIYLAFRCEVDAFALKIRGLFIKPTEKGKPVEIILDRKKNQNKD